ncbi:hypothetical protein HY639_00500 [Candidatus Woesearchaeota archaeon]|nr:hypothetical protein [Candidatus Woesearchaeota archaeon]
MTMALRPVSTMDKDLGIIGTVARFKPVHHAHALMLETMCQRAAHVTIGIGSSNRYNVRNPFTAKESADMIRLVLKPYTNYSLFEVPDLDDGPKWREQALALWPDTTLFVTANPYVELLLKDKYELKHPIDLIPEEKRVRVSGTMVRYAMARGEPWEHLVPDQVGAYLKQGLVERFCCEFGLETIAKYAFEGDL